MQIFLKVNGGHSSLLHVERNSTIRDLKLKIQENKGIPVEQQRLTLWLMGKVLDRNNLYLSDYNVHSGSTISVQIKGGYKTNPKKIFVKTVDDITIHLDVEPNNTIQTVKQKLESLQNISAEYHRLIYSGQLLSERETLSNLGIIHNAILEIVFCAITVKMINDETFILPSAEKVKDLKLLIEERNGVPVQEQIILFNERQLNNDELIVNNEMNLTLSICESYQNYININYIKIASNKAEKLKQQFLRDIAYIDKLLVDAKNQIKTASALSTLRSIRAKVLSTVEFTGHKDLKSFESDIDGIKQSLTNNWSKQVIKCKRKNDSHQTQINAQQDEIQMIKSTMDLIKSQGKSQDKALEDKYNELNRRTKAMRTFCEKNYYRFLCAVIKDKNIKALDDRLSEMEHVYHSNLQTSQHQEELKEAINERVQEFEDNFNLWNFEGVIEWILLIENGYFEHKTFNEFIEKLKEMEIDGNHLKEMNNKLLLNMIGLKQQKDQYIIRKHINRIIQYENEKNDQSMCGLCIENSINTVIIPCGHQYHCYQCSQNYQDDRCPICRNGINQILRTYLSGFSK